MTPQLQNHETPPRSFRLPSREMDRLLVHAARTDGMTTSEFIRRAIAHAIAASEAGRVSVEADSPYGDDIHPYEEAP